MAPDDTDRRRFRLAAIVSLLALPALWWINLDDPTTGPNTASVGVDVGGTETQQPVGSSEVPTIESTVGRSNLPTEPTVLETPPIFLDGPTAQVGGAAEIAIPDADAIDSIVARASYGDLAGNDTCLANNLTFGQIVTVTNLDNNRTISCRVAFAPFGQTADLVLSAAQFTELADLTDAPIPVQIRR